MTRSKFGLGVTVAVVALVAAVTAAVSVGSASASDVCANYTSYTNTSNSVTVTFQVNSDGCQVTLWSYQSTVNGPTNSQFSSGTFNTGTHTLTVPLTCGTDNQVDLFLGSTPPPYPTASTDLQSLSITPSCAPPPPSVCTYTKGYYKNHSSAVTGYYNASSALSGMFSLAQVNAILQTSPSNLPAGQGGTLNLLQQAVTALLNEGKGATASSSVNSAISAALAGIHISWSGTTITSVTASGIDVGGLTNTIEPFNSATDCG